MENWRPPATYGHTRLQQTAAQGMWSSLLKRNLPHPHRRRHFPRSARSPHRSSLRAARSGHQAGAGSASRNLPLHRWARPPAPPSPHLGAARQDGPPGPPALSLARPHRRLLLSPAPGAYPEGAARPPGRRGRSRCSSSAGAAGTGRRPGRAPPRRLQGAASAGAAGSGPRGAARGCPPPRPAGRGQRQWCAGVLGAVRPGQVAGPL